MTLPLPSGNIATSFFPTSLAFTGSPEQEAKVQPWKNFYRFTEVKGDGQLVVACPKSYDFSSSGLGGV